MKLILFGWFRWRYISSIFISKLKILHQIEITSFDYKLANLSDLLKEYEVLEGELLRG